MMLYFNQSSSLHGFRFIYLTVVVDGEVVGDSRRPTAVVWPPLVTGVGVPVSELKSF